MKKKQKGFTFIEMLIVISIITVLTMVGAASYRTVTVNSRDQQRSRDLNTVKQALELYRNDFHYYPADGEFDLATSKPLLSKDGSKTYLSPVPTDPSKKKYIYKALPDGCSNSLASGYCNRYVLCTKIESALKGSTCQDLLQSVGIPTPKCGTDVGDTCNFGVPSD